MKPIKYIIPALIAVIVIISSYLLYSFTTLFTSWSPLKDCKNCNLVVILVDTLRADHLPFYGYKNNTAPFLNEIAQKSVVFERAFSSSSWTAPATASVFTAQPPSVHGVITGFLAIKGFKKKDPKVRFNRIPDKFITMPEVMRQAGYTTIGVADNLNIGREIGFDRGFEHFKKFRYIGAKKLRNQVEEFIDNSARNRPYFLYIHFMDPHDPYKQRSPWYNQCLMSLDADGIAIKKMDKTRCAYSSEIGFVDQNIRELFEKYHWEKNSVVVFLSDHGEEFKEHGKTGHGQSLYSELIKVPFFIFHPEWKPGKIQSNVNTMDLLPTISGLISAKANPQNPKWRGRNLLKMISNEDENLSRPVISERLRNSHSKHNWSKRSVIQDDWHFIRTDNTGGTEKLESELFNLSDDPGEQNNLVVSKIEKVRHLEDILEQESPVDGSKADNDIEIEPDQELLNDLKTLGYID